MQAYSAYTTGVFRTLPHSNHWHLEPEAYSKRCQTLTRYVQKPAIVRTVYPGIIQPYSGIFRTLCKPAYADP